MMTMTLSSVAAMLDTIERLADEDRTEEIKAVIARARAELLDDDAFVTTTQAARLLGIGSINTVKSMVRHGEIADTCKVGNRTMIPMAEIRRLQGTELVRDLRAIAHALRSDAPLETEKDNTPLSREEMDILEVGRPGAPPWQR